MSALPGPLSHARRAFSADLNLRRPPSIGADLDQGVTQPTALEFLAL
jgi:hypothetical protein